MSKLTSTKVISIIESGHHVEAFWNDNEEERERMRERIGREPVKIVLRPATDEERTEHVSIMQERVQDGETVKCEPIHAPGIDSLLRERSWSVNKQD